jgi:integrase
MGCLCRDPKSEILYWSYRAADGRRLKKSTRVPASSPDARRIAKEVGEAMEKAESVIKRGVAIGEQLRKIIDETLERAGEPKLDDPTVAEWLARWIKNQDGSVSPNSLRRYQSAVDVFQKFLGPRANARLNVITPGEIVRFRDQLLSEGRSESTVNLLVTVILKSAFTAAVRDGVLFRNPIASVRSLRVEKAERGVFSPGEVSRLIRVAKGEWKTLITLAYFTGQRLRDCVELGWQDIDVDEGRIIFQQQKRRKRVVVPIHAELSEHLNKISLPEATHSPLFPKLSKEKINGSQGLSAQFRKIMDKAGIESGVARKRGGKAGHNVSVRSFHSLRHSCISQMMNAGIAPEIRQRISGHSSLSIHQDYSHAEWRTLNTAIQAIDRLPKPR